jgi:hypothetical protein
MSVQRCISKIKKISNVYKHNKGWRNSSRKRKKFSYKETLSIRGVKKLGN